MAIFAHETGVHVLVTNPGDDPIALLTPPDAVLVIPEVPPIGVLFRRRLYEAGQFNRPIVHTEFGQTHAIGIQPPPASILSLGAGSGGSSGFVNGYVTFAQEEDGIIIAESMPTLAGGGQLLATGQGFVWTNLPTVSGNSRVNVIRLWREVDGEVGALVTALDLGTTTYTENVPTLELGPETLPVKQAPDGTFVADYNANGVLPYVTMVEIYHNAGAWAGDPEHPYRVYMSQINRPEAVNTDEDDQEFFDTLEGEAVTGLARHGDELIVFIAEGKYSIQGFSSKDRSIRKIDNYYGCISRYSTRRYNPDSDLFFASAEGPCSYNGRTTFLGKEMADWWRDAYAANIEAFELCFAAEDRYFQTVHLVVPAATGAGFTTFPFVEKPTMKMVLHYEPIMIGEQPWWVFDVRQRADRSMGTFSLPGQLHKKLYTGSCDGLVREENVEDDADDDGDSYAKRMTLLHKHKFFDDQCGDDSKGKVLTDSDVFILNQDQDATVSYYGGDDHAADAFEAPRHRGIKASRLPTSKRQRVPRTASHIPNVMIGGKGFSTKVEVVAPIRVEYRGLALYHRPSGVQDRGFIA